MKNTYWNGNGKYQGAYDLLLKMVPVQGECENAKTTNKHLDKMRRAGNCYYDLFNNGLCNRAAEFRHMFGFSPKRKYRGFSGRGDINFCDALDKETDAVMDRYIEAAAKEQRIDLNTPKVIEARPIHRAPEVFVQADH